MKITPLTKNTPVVFHFRYMQLPWNAGGGRGINNKLTHYGSPEFKYIQSHGGITVVYFPEKRCFSVAVCSSKDPFIRKVGVQIAVNRMNSDGMVVGDSIVQYDYVKRSRIGLMNHMNNVYANTDRMKHIVSQYEGEQTLQAVREAANVIAYVYMEC